MLPGCSAVAGFFVLSTVVQWAFSGSLLDYETGEGRGQVFFEYGDAGADYLPDRSDQLISLS
ncbi:hypothetical protein D9M73_180070 [compost metagenome]